MKKYIFSIKNLYFFLPKSAKKLPFQKKRYFFKKGTFEKYQPSDETHIYIIYTDDFMLSPPPVTLFSVKKGGGT